MAKITIFVPKSQMIEHANKILREERLEIHRLKRIETEDAVNEARDAIEDGTTIIVARGVQSKLIKRYTNVPVVEIRLTGQELALLITKAKQMVKSDYPKIGIIGFENMFSDMTYFESLFQIKLSVYYIDSVENIPAVVKTAVMDGNEIIIGGDSTITAAQNHGVRSLFFESTEDSMRQAILVAKQMAYTSDVEKQNHAQLETIFDTSFNGIIKVNRGREIIAVNKLIENLFNRKAEEIVGLQLDVLLKELDMDLVEEILQGRRENYSTSFQLHDIPLTAVMAPIQYDDTITGAILTLHKIKSIVRSESSTKKEMYLNGYVAQDDLKKITSGSPLMKRNIELAKQYALSQRPVLIYGEHGTEREIFAQGIHNLSNRRDGPFITINCSGTDEKMQEVTVFGDGGKENDGSAKGALSLANYGTLLIQEIETLSLHCQYQLYRAIQYNTLIQNDAERIRALNVRIMATAGKQLSHLVKEGKFREDLYYLLNGLTLDIPPLRERQEDIEMHLKEFIKKYANEYAKFLTIAPNALEMLRDFHWEGNLIQLDSYCERLILTADRRMIDEAAAKKLLSEMYPIIRKHNGEDKIVIFKHPQAAVIADLLQKHGGSRDKVAKELGISTTTLWRHMKKYGVENKYDI